jgi:hypothetical protein
MAETLLQKLAKIRAEVKHVDKAGWNDYHKYFYVKEEDAIEAVRGLLIREGVFLFPNYTLVGREGDITTVLGEFTFIHEVPDIKWLAEDGSNTGPLATEELTFRIPGQGADKGDKGIYKAETGALKQLLMKVFLMPTGDDPEAEGEEKKTTKKATTVATKPDEGAKTSIPSEPPNSAVPRANLNPDNKEARNAELKRLADEVLPKAGIKKAREVLGAWIKVTSGQSDLRTLTLGQWAPIMAQLKEMEATGKFDKLWKKSEEK